MQAGVIDLCGEGHGCRREVLHLLEVEVELLGLDGKLCHVLDGAPRMRRYEVWYELLAQTCALVLAIEKGVELAEKLERRLAHEAQDGVGRVLRSDFQTSGQIGRASCRERVF